MYTPQTRSRTVSRRSHKYHDNLPVQAALVGRADECQKIGMLLQSKRLVTLAGPGGVGKTSLALALAQGHLAHFEHGVYFVPLSGITSHLFLVSAIAEAIQFSFHESGDFKTQLLDYLYDLDILLVLDNFEHLLPNTELIPELLQATQNTKVLVTSRQHLDLRAEWVFELQGLSFPSDELSTPTSNYAAIELFTAQAQKSRPDFTLHDANLSDVVAICRLVDGLPLAIELAASWTRALTCRQIARQIEQDLDFLAATWQDLPEKHRTIRGVLAQSWGMLDSSVQAVLRKLSIFQGDFNLDAAQQIASASISELALLVDRSLLQYDPAGRYKMHPLMQQYSRERLTEAQEVELISVRHCEYFAGFLQQQATEIQGVGQRQALEQIGAEIENVRLAWDWAVQQYKPGQIAQSLEVLSQFYLLRGYFRDGEACFSQAIRRLQELPQDAEATRLVGQLAVRQAIFLQKMGQYPEAQTILETQLPILVHSTPGEAVIYLRELAYLAYRQGDSERAKQLALDGLSRCQETGNTAENIRILHILSNIEREAARYEKAYRYLEEALTLSTADRFPQLHASSLQNLGIYCNHQRDYEKARALYHDALTILREIADRPGESLALIQLGVTYTHKSHFSQAIQCYEEAIPILREIGDQRTLGRAFGNLGVLFQRLGMIGQAQTNLEQALQILRRVGEMRGQCMAMSNISHCYFQQGNYAKAQSYAREFLGIAKSIGDRTALGYAWANLGDALSGQQEWSAAQDAYQRSIELRKSVGEAHYILDPLAGLARVALALEDLPLALEYIETVLVVEDGLEKSRGSLDILFICYQVLRAHQDPRARNLLAQAHERLQAQAARIDDTELQHSYLENVPVHKEILAAVVQENAPPTSSSGVSTVQADPGLTRRELEVLQWMAAGNSNQEIADGLCISLSTVKRHITNLHHKLGVQRRTQAISRARELGLL
jgi:predicted ATPase/DNA-binding CsgD family transcriptional regulator/Tfp pilus assembly protein PilF